MKGHYNRNDRNTGIGASEVATLFGFTQFCTEHELWYKKVNKLCNEENNVNEPVLKELAEYGTWAEGYTRDRFKEKFKPSFCKKPAFLKRHKSLKYIFASPDGIAIINDKKYILECKTAGAFDKKYGEQFTDEIPLWYNLQVQQQLLCYGLDSAYIAVLKDRIVNYYTINRNDDICNAIVKRVTDFWVNYVETKITPPENVVATIEIKPDSSIEVTDDIFKLLTEYKELKFNEKDNKAKLDELGSKIKEFMGDKQILIDNQSNKLAKLINVKGRTSLNTTKLKSELPDIYNQYVTTGEPSIKLDVMI